LCVVVVVTLPVVYSSSSCDIDAELIVADTHQPYIRRVLLPSFDPRTLYFDRSQSALAALARNSRSKNPSNFRYAIDKLLSDVVSPKASLWTICLESENWLVKKPHSEEPTVKPLCELAAECRDRSQTEDISDLKCRLSVILGNSMPPANCCHLLLSLPRRSFLSISSTVQLQASVSSMVW